MLSRCSRACRSGDPVAAAETGSAGPQQGWSGSLQTDGYELYAGLAKERPSITRFGCMAHCQRKVSDAIKAGDAVAVPLPLEIGKLDAIETEATQRGLSDDQRGYRAMRGPGRS